jgi:uncharacterized membrane protein YdjX (TVP38/TMEM64 family)
MSKDLTFADLVTFINSDLSPLLFIMLMVFLPMFGFPISVFLIVAGIKFGIFHAVLLWLFILLLHALTGYAAAKHLRPLLKKMLNNTLGYKIPAVPAEHEAMFSFLFLAIPGIPYAAKNYLLPLAGVSVRYCVVMNCLVQSLLGLPFIILGKSGAELNPTLFAIAIFLLTILFLLLTWLKKKYAKSNE